MNTSPEINVVSTLAPNIPLMSAEFKDFVQDLIDRHVLQVNHQRKEGEVFTGEEWIPQRPKPLVIQFIKATTLMPSGSQPLVIQTPSSFSYKNDKVVPWKYGVSIVQGEQKKKNQLSKTRQRLITSLE